MTAQKGKDLLLKVDTNGAGSFVTVAGLRARTLAFNAATVDVTDTEFGWALARASRRRRRQDRAHHRQRHLQGCQHRRDCAPVFLQSHGAELAGDRSGARHGRGAVSDREPRDAGAARRQVSVEMGFEFGRRAQLRRRGVRKGGAMVNRHRGEIEAILDGKSYRLS